MGLGVLWASEGPLCKASVLWELSPGKAGEGTPPPFRAGGQPPLCLGALCAGTPVREASAPHACWYLPAGSPLSRRLWLRTVPTPLRSTGSVLGMFHLLLRGGRGCGSFLCPVGHRARASLRRVPASTAGAEQTGGLSGGRGFIFSRTASVILSLWRHQARGHQAPGFSCRRGKWVPGQPVLSVRDQDLSHGVCVRETVRQRERQKCWLKLCCVTLGRLLDLSGPAFISSPASCLGQLTGAVCASVV